jgi:dihydropteroate synthase
MTSQNPQSAIRCPQSPPPLVCRSRTFDFADGPFIMGILNVTPDSFSDGGAYPDAQSAVASGLELAARGADIIDVGGESTRPGASPVPLAQELARVLPVIQKLAEKTTVPISIDTTKAEVARQALAAGAQMVNDVSALRFDVAMARVVAESGVPVVLMHMRGAPATMQQNTCYTNLIEELTAFFHERLAAAVAAGIAEDKIIIDPGIGFGKSVDTDNFLILQRLHAFAGLGRPVLIGPSRKAFIGRVTNREAAQRDDGTAAAVAVAVYNGAHIVRVHNAAMMRDVARIAAAIKKAR